MKASLRWASLVVVVLGFAVFVAAILGASWIEEPLRSWFVREINEPLDGYSLTLGGMDVHPSTLSVTLEELSVFQDALPERPIVAIPRIDGSLDWRALLSGALVVSVRVDRPVIHIDLKQLREEAGDPDPLSERGWQEAITNVTPLKVNDLRIVDGELTYLDEPKGEPIRVDELNLRASNIRNVRSRPGDHPSPIRVDARVFDTAALHVDGAMDFLALPRPNGRIDFTLAEAELARLEPVAHHVGLELRGGVLTTSGTLESTQGATSVVLREIRFDGIEADYVETRTPTVAKKAIKGATKRAAKAVSTPSDASKVSVVIQSLEVTKSNFGFVNATVAPRYRLFVDVTAASLHDFSNGKRRKDVPMTLDGRFMNSGTLRVRGSIRPDRDGPDFAVSLQLKDVEITTLNKALLAHGDLDVVAGQLSVFSELDVRDRVVNGYVKPLVTGLDVYDPSQDDEKSLGSRIYQGTIGAVAKLLKNEPLDRVATVTPIAGRLEAVDAGAWQTFVLLLRNAFVEAIRGGLEPNGEA